MDINKPKSEQAWKVEVLKTDRIQQHKYRALQQLIGRLSPPTETSGQQAIPGFLYSGPSTDPSLVTATAQRVLAGKQTERTQDGEEPAWD